MNSVVIIGRIGNDIELKITSNNKKVVEFSLADTEKQNNENITTWFNCIAWEGLAETINKYAHKGDMIGIRGKIRNSKYTNKDGQERTKTYVLVENLQLLPNERK